MISKRPDFGSVSDTATLYSYCFLKEELKSYSKDLGLPSSGSKAELTKRIAHYLDTGSILPSAPKMKAKSQLRE